MDHLAQVPIPDFHETARSFGLAVAILISVAAVLLLAIVMLARWIKPRAEKLIDSHLETMETFRRNDDDRTKSLALMANSQSDMTNAIEQQNRLIRDQSSKLDSLNNTLKSSILLKTDSTVINVDHGHGKAGSGS